MGLCFDSWLRDNFDMETNPDFDGAFLEKVEVSKKKARWLLYLNLRQPVERPALDRLAGQICKRHLYLEGVDFKVRVADDQSVNKMLSDRRVDLACFCQEKAFAELPEEVRLKAEGYRLKLIVDQDDTYERLLGSNICSAIGDWFRSSYSLDTVVTVLKNPVGSKKKNHQQYIIDQNAHDPAVAYNPSLNNPFATRQRKSLHKKIKGEALPIRDLAEGMRGTVVDARVMERQVKAIKGGSYLVSYSLTDYTDSIGAFVFTETPDQDRVTEGQWMRFQGMVRFDRYSHDMALSIDAMMAIEHRGRQDEAETTRVELHAHTKMSSMDGLTDVEELVKTASRWGHPAIAITDHGCVQSFPEAYKAGKKYGIKIIFGVEAYLVEEDRREKPFHIIILARDEEGLRSLYRLVSIGYIENFHSHPKIRRCQLQENRQGLLLGSACEKGEIFQAMLRGADDEELARIAAFYDYLEVQPPDNNRFLVRNGQLSEDELLALTGRIVELGQRCGLPVVATGDVHFLEPHDEVFKTILLAGQGYKDAEAVAPLYFKSTAEMLEDFAFLNEEVARQLVVDNPRRIADSIPSFQPVPEGFCPPVIDGSEEEITVLTMDRARAIYGEALPEIVRERIERELKAIIGYGYSVLYLVAHKLVRKSNEDGYLVGSRGSVGSSLVAFMTGITEVNALPAHYICPQCRHSQFIEDGSVSCGPDLPDKDCPVCGTALKKDGFDIPFETFMGFDGDKVPDIDLNFSGDYQSRAHAYVEEIFGRENVFRAGTISTIAEQTAFGFVKKWTDEKNLHLRQAEMNRLARGITGVRRTTGQHPGGLVVVPRGRQITDFTPIQHPADKKDGGIITTHFDYHAIDEQLVKLDILGHDDPTAIRMLEDITGVRATEISLSDPTTLSLFSGVDALGVKPEDIGSEVGTLGVPEFGTRFVRQMLKATRPTCFADLVRISGLSHGTDVWLNNASDLIKDNTASLAEVICTRDDIMTYLIYQHMEKKQAFKIMESVRKGKGLNKEESMAMMDCGVPEWYVESCRRIKYMFPKAHAVAYVTMSFRIAWFKIFHALAFYAAYFSIRADEIDPPSMLGGMECLRSRIKEIDTLGTRAPEKEKKMLTNLEVALEMLARGFCFQPVNLLQSDATRFIITNQGLLMPFAALNGVGENAARAIVTARQQSPFISVEDLQGRARLNKTVIETLRQEGCLEDLPENSQISLF